jgi:hypothetical protein
MGAYLLSKKVLSHDVSLHHHLLLKGLPSVSERTMIVPLLVETRASSITGQPRMM